MPVLELPGGGITRPKYDRVIANSLEELTAFIPEVPHVWGMVRGQFTRRYWDGAEWKVAGVIGSGPLASAPAASAGNQDMWYQSTDFGLCLSRSTVYLDGPDTLTFAPPVAALSSVDWYLSWVQSDRAILALGNRIMNIFAGSTSVLRINQVAGGAFALSLSNNGSAIIASVTHPTPITDTAFHLFGIEKTGNNIALIIDGVSASTSIGAWTAGGATAVEFKDSGADLRPLALANIKQCDSVNCNDFFPCTEISGTVIANATTPARPATISDGTAHAYSWVPQSLLQ